MAGHLAAFGELAVVSRYRSFIHSFFIVWLEISGLFRDVRAKIFLH